MGIIGTLFKNTWTLRKQTVFTLLIGYSDQKLIFVLSEAATSHKHKKTSYNSIDYCFV